MSNSVVLQALLLFLFRSADFIFLVTLNCLEDVHPDISFWTHPDFERCSALRFECCCAVYGSHLHGLFSYQLGSFHRICAYMLVHAAIHPACHPGWHPAIHLPSIHVCATKYLLVIEQNCTSLGLSLGFLLVNDLRALVCAASGFPADIHVWNALVLANPLVEKHHELTDLRHRSTMRTKSADFR